MSDYAACIFCDLLWSILVMGVTAYAVFWLDHSGWWFLLAILLCIRDCSTKGRSRSIHD